jgi:hypothetical protein
MDGALAGAGSPWPTKGTNMEMYWDGALKVGNFKAREKETESPGKLLVEPLDNE